MVVPIEVLETTRLILRPVSQRDQARIQLLFPQWEVVKYLADVVPWPYPADGARTFLQRLLPEIDSGIQYAWAITSKAANDDLLMGVVTLTPTNPDDSRGFWLGLEYQRQGLMTEAVEAINDFAFDKLGMTRLLLNNAEPNIGSHRIKEISGATIIGIDDDVPFVGGRFRKVRWELTREVWQERHR